MALPILDGNQSATTLSTILTGGAHIPAHTVVSLGSQAISDITSAVSGISVSIGGTQTTTFGAVTGSVSVLNFPSTQTVAGTVTANVPLSPDVWAGTDGIRVVGNGSDGALRIGGYDPSSGAQLNLEEGGGIPVFAAGQVALPISGTVTANVFGNLNHSSGSYAGNVVPVQIIRTDDDVAGMAGAPLIVAFDSNSGSTTVTVSSLPSGALTTRFGSVTTANTAQITSAVTNTNRKYLLAQNISTGTVTIGIGFSPTTTQGIQLTAGGGLTFDAFCPTGAVYWLGAVTGAAYTILEG